MLRHPQQVVVDVAEVGGRSFVDRLDPDRQLGERRLQRIDGAAEVEDLSLELEDPFGVRLVRAAEHLVLDLVDVAVQAAHDDGVVVDDLVGDRVQHRSGTPLHALRIGLERPANVGQRGCRTVADGDHEVGADEHHQLADLDDLVTVDVPGRLEHDEQAVAVPLELRALVGVDGVLDGERVQVEGPGRRSRTPAPSARTARSTRTRRARGRRPAPRRRRAASLSRAPSR